MFSVTSGYLKFWSENTLVPGISKPKPKIPLVSYSSCFHFLVHPPCMFDPRNFLCCGLFWLCFIYFLSEGHIYHCLPLSSSGVYQSDCALLLSLVCNHRELQWSEYREENVCKHEGPWSWWQVNTRGLGCLLIGWSCQNKFVLLVPKFKFQPGEPRRSHASPLKHLGLATLQPLFKPQSIGCLQQQDGGILNTLLSQLPLLSPIAGALCTLGCSACPSSATM